MKTACGQPKQLRPTVLYFRAILEVKQIVTYCLLVLFRDSLQLLCCIWYFVNRGRAKDSRRYKVGPGKTFSAETTRTGGWRKFLKLGLLYFLQTWPFAPLAQLFWAIYSHPPSTMDLQFSTSRLTCLPAGYRLLRQKKKTWTPSGAVWVGHKDIKLPKYTTQKRTSAIINISEIVIYC